MRVAAVDDYVYAGQQPQLVADPLGRSSMRYVHEHDPRWDESLHELLHRLRGIEALVGQLPAHLRRGVAADDPVSVIHCGTSEVGAHPPEPDDPTRMTSPVTGRIR